MTVGERIKKIRKHFKLTQSDFCKQTGLKNALSLINYEKGKTKPGMEFLANLTRVFNVRVDWVISGQGSMFFEKKGAERGPGKNSRTGSLPALLAKELDFFVSEDDADEKEIKELKTFRVRGDAMEPTLRDKGLAFLNSEDQTIRSGCTYLVKYLEEFYIRRLNRMDERNLEMIPDNPKYETTVLDTQTTPIEIVGRVVFAGHSI